MKEIKIAEGFYLYQFSEEENRILGQNIYVLYHDKECIVFDAGYQRHMKEVKEKIKGYDIKYVILTHFHPDHSYGLFELDKQTVIGSDEGIETLKFFEADGEELLIPSITVKDRLDIVFHNHHISLVKNPGHSRCGLLIEVDHKYLLTGDEFMTTNEGLPVLPYVADKVDTHIMGLNNIINNYSKHTFLPAHGSITSDIEVLKSRVRYLEFAKKRIVDMDKFYEPGQVRFLNEKGHRLNIRKV